jgi:hypothetical protein
MPGSPIQVQALDAIQAATRPTPRALTGPALPTVVVAGATGSLGHEVMRLLAGAGRHGAVTVITQEPVQEGMRGLRTLALHPDVAHWGPARPGLADIGVLLFEPPRLYHDRERALFTPNPQNWLAVAAWLRASGVNSLALAMPHVQGRLPASLQAGLANLEEQAGVALGFERFILLRTAQKEQPRSNTDEQAPSFLAGVARRVLGAMEYMLPASEKPVRTRHVAALLHDALQLAPAGVHVASGELVWRVAQAADAQAARDLARAWLVRS